MRLSERLEDLARLAQEPQVTLGELVDRLTATGHMFLCLFFCLPFLLPIPIPGLSTPFGIIITSAAIQFVLGKKPWLPRRIRQRVVDGQTLAKMLQTGAKWWQKIEHIVRCRWTIFTKGAVTRKINGALVALLGVILALPLPPGFNAIPSLAIISLTVGELEDDGVLVFIGYILSLLNVVLVTLLFTVGFEEAKKFF